MKFKFINKAKDVNPADIQAKMNFGKVAQSAKALSSAKLSAGILKLGTSTVTTVVTTSAVVVTAVTIGVTNPEIFKSKVVEEQPVIEKIVEQPVQEPIEEQPALIVQEPEEEAPVIEAEPEEEITEVIETPEAIIEKVDSIANVEIVNSYSENILIEPTPLPSVDAFLAFIERELKYPVEHLEDPIEGIVEVRFTVNEEGKAVNFKIKKSLGELFDNEAKRVLRKYQNWQPASYNGQAVEYNMDIKVRFETK